MSRSSIEKPACDVQRRATPRGAPQHHGCCPTVSGVPASGLDERDVTQALPRNESTVDGDGLAGDEAGLG